MSRSLKEMTYSKHEALKLSAHGVGGVVSYTAGQLLKRGFGLLLFVFFVSGCYLDLKLDQGSLSPIEILSHEINELSLDHVVIRLHGKCPVKVDQVESKVEGKGFLLKNNHASFKDLRTMSFSKQEMVSNCDAEGNYQALYLAPDPNEAREILFQHIAIPNKGAASVPTSYIVDYKRPPLPVPSLPGSDQIYTNQPSYELEGYCIAERVTGLEYRLDNKLDGSSEWKALSCEPGEGDELDQWKISLAPPLPALVGSPETSYIIEVRSVNSNSVHEHSDILKVTLHVDTISPETITELTGVLHGKDEIYGEWMKSEFPQVGWNEDSDIFKVQVMITGSSEESVICAPKESPSVGALLFEGNDCNENFIENETYHIKLSGFDKAGNLSTQQSTKPFRVDRIPPEAQWVSTAPATTEYNFAEFKWSGSVSDGSPLNDVESTCSLNGAPFLNCPYGEAVVNNLAAGKNHTFQVRVYDVAGNYSALDHSWYVEGEVVPPACTFTLTEAQWMGESPLNVNFECQDDDSGVRFVQCRLGVNSAWSDCTTTTSHTLSVLSSGTYKFQVRAQDNAGNLSEIIQKNIYVDIDPPTTIFTSTPLLMTNETTALIAYTVSDSGTASGLESIECRLNSNEFSVCVSEPSLYSTMSLFSQADLSEGFHKFEVKAKDRMGNESVTAFNWEVDLTPPGAPIMPPDADNGLQPEWTWSSGGGGNGVFRYKLNDDDLSSGFTEAAVLSFTPAEELGFGAHTLYVQERDEAGNWSAISSTTFEAKCSHGEFLTDGNCAVCPVGSYQDEFNVAGSCKPAPLGTYTSYVGSTSPTSCPANSTTIEQGASSLEQCLADGGYYECQDGNCNNVGSGYYSGANDNTRSECPVNTFSGGFGSEADSVEDCLPGVDYYFKESGEVSLVADGSYSPYRSTEVLNCTNTPPNAISVLYSSRGGGENNCAVSTVLACFSPEFIIEGVSCVDNTPDSFSFDPVNNAEPSSVVESNAVTLAGFDGPLTATCSDCLDIARNGVWGGPVVEGFMPGDTIAVRRNAALSFATGVSTTVTLGQTTSANWVIGSRAAYTCSLEGFGSIEHLASVTAFEYAGPLTADENCTSVASEQRTCNDGVLSGSFTNKECRNGCFDTLWGNVPHGFEGTAYSSNLPTSLCSAVSQVRKCQDGVMSGTFPQTSCLSGCGFGLKHNQSKVFYAVERDDDCTTVHSRTQTCTNGSLSGNYTALSCQNYIYELGEIRETIAEPFGQKSSCSQHSDSGGNIIISVTPSRVLTEDTLITCGSYFAHLQAGSTTYPCYRYRTCNRR